MTFFTALIFLSVIFCAHLASGNVLDLHKSDFDSTTSNNKYVLVEFYAPWCGHCKAFEPEFSKTAQLLELNGSPVKIAKVNVEEEKVLATEKGVRSYPTLKLYSDGLPMDYHGTKTANDIVQWLQMKTAPINDNKIDM